MSSYFRAILILLFISITPYVAKSQTPNKGFGKNRIQYKTFDWSYLSTLNYDIYYYKDGYENARLASEIVEEDFDQITDIIGYSPYTKTKVFLYNSVSELRQSNIGINEQNFSGGGQTNFFKSQVEIAFPGTISGFKKELSYNVAKMLITDMMFGGNLKDMLQNSFLLTLPEWFMEGAALYVSQGWSIDMDDVIRDKFTRGKIKKLSAVKGTDAGYIGQSIWNFVAEKYGRVNISNILNLTRIIRNEESSISSTLGISFNRFLGEWRSYYMNVNENVLSNYTEPVAKSNLRNKNPKKLLYNKVKLNTTGDYLAYSENYKGNYKVYVRRTNSKRTKVALAGGHKVINQKVDPNIPLLSWRDERYLGIINVKKGKSYFWLYDATRGKKSKREIKTLSQIQDFNFAPDGNALILSAVQGGQSDLFMMNINNGAIQQLTRDIYDDVNPIFVPGTESIVFASNRITDTLSTKKAKATKLDENYNIFIYTPDTSKILLKRVSNTISKEVKPIPINNNEILYLSDQKGIFNLYKYKIDQNIFTQITNNSVSINNYDINVAKGMIAYTGYYKGSSNVFLINNFNFNENNFTQPTRRQEIIQARALVEKRQGKQEFTTSPVIRELQIAIQDSTNVAPDTASVISRDTVKTASVVETEKKAADEIDTDDYQFESSPKKESRQDTVRKSSILKTYAVKPAKELKIEGPFPYLSRFSANNAVATLTIDPLRSLGIQLEMEMTDMLENHKFYGGYVAFLDLRSSNLFAEYQYLKRRVDLSARIDRKTYFIERNQGETVQKYSLNKLELGAAYPFSLTSRISIHPFYAHTRYNDVDDKTINAAAPTPNFNSTNYGGFRAEFVYDNSLVSGLNIISGTRFKIRFENYNGIFNERGEKRGFNNFNIDFRRYTKIHKEIILATRAVYGQYFGVEKPEYILGGMLNSLSLSYPRNEPLNFSRGKENTRMLFSEFAAPLRGFGFNKANGSQVLMANVELRFPIVSYFYKGPISSNFFRNLQFIGFFDVGSAWDGIPPFSNDNSINTEEITSGPFRVRVKSFQNPWLSSYGAGMRTMLFGYFVKLDAAWGVENYVVNKPKLYLTIGQDF